MKQFLALGLFVLALASCNSYSEVINATPVPTIWYIEKYNGKPIVMPVLSAGKPYLVFNPVDSTLRGNTGCNVLFAKYSVPGVRKLYIPKVKYSLNACGPNDSLIAGDLRQITSYGVKKNKMYLFNKNGKVLYYLEASRD
ncbi:MAG: META domain-containing protein [Bacteroidetes bacterium]|nr:META domain-containing protein [Bacteroidota bacterium]